MTDITHTPAWRKAMEELAHGLHDDDTFGEADWDDLRESTKLAYLAAAERDLIRMRDMVLAALTESAEPLAEESPEFKAFWAEFERFGASTHGRPFGEHCLAGLNAAVVSLQARIQALEAEHERLMEKTGAAVTVGGGLSVYGSIEAIGRVQDYILLDSTHQVEATDVRRSLMRQLEAAERQRDAAIAAMGLAVTLLRQDEEHAALQELQRVLSTTEPAPRDSSAPGETEAFQDVQLEASGSPDNGPVHWRCNCLALNSVWRTNCWQCGASRFQPAASTEGGSK